MVILKQGFPSNWTFSTERKASVPKAPDIACTMLTGGVILSTPTSSGVLARNGASVFTLQPC